MRCACCEREANGWHDGARSDWPPTCDDHVQFAADTTRAVDALSRSFIRRHGGTTIENANDVRAAAVNSLGADPVDWTRPVEGWRLW